MSTFPACRITVLVALTVALLVLPAHSAQTLTERDWMIALVDSLGRSFGLPDAPKPDDYINILSGKRNLRFEAETTYSADDDVSVMAFRNYGPFSGPGWLLGGNEPATVHLRFLLPLDGRYRMAIAARRPGHLVDVGGQRFGVDGGAQVFSRGEVGEVVLNAGLQEIVVILPPGGALDHLELAAPNLPPIAPDGGWRPEAPLTWESLAITAVQALGLERELPLTDRIVEVEAESLAEIGESRVIEDTHLGRPSGGRWLRTAAQPVTIVVPLTVDRGGFYDLGITAMGAEIGGLLNNHLPLTISGKPYLDTTTTSPLFLSKGANRLELTLPPGGGLDRVTLRARQSELSALAAVLGLTMAGDAPTSADLDRLTVRISTTNR